MVELWPDAVMLACRALAAGVFIASGVLKFGRSAELQASLVPLGFSPRLAESAFVRTFAVPAFPYGELLVGFGLFLAPGAWGVLFAAAAIALYAGFLVLTARVVIRGDAAECDCFGGLTDGAVTWFTVLRNLFFLMLAIAGSLAVMPSVTVGLQGVGGAVLVTAVLVLVRAWRERRARTAALAGLDLEDAAGRSVALRTLVERDSAFIFLSASCMSCQAVARELASFSPESDDRSRVNVVLMGTRVEFEYFEAFHGLLGESVPVEVWFDGEKAVAKAMGRLGTPGLVLAGPKAPLGEGWVRGAEAIRDLLRERTAR